MYIQYQHLITIGQPKQIWLHVAGAVVVIWWLSRNVKITESDVLNPTEARACIMKEIEQMKKERIIPESRRAVVGRVGHLQWINGLPGSYYPEVRFIEPGIDERLIACCPAEGRTKGYVTFEESIGSVTGTEKPHIKPALPPWMADAKKQGIDINRMIFSGGKQ